MAPMTGTVVTDWKPDIASSPKDLKGKNVAVIGGTSGLGRAIALKAAEDGANVTVVGRSFKDDPDKIHFIKADLSSMKEAKRIGETIDPLVDVVVFTTGIFAKAERVETEEGIELDMAVSYLSRLVILKFLVPRLTKKPTRVFIMGFPGGALDPINVDDLNSEKSYKGGPDWVHFNTVAGNEALVLDWSKVSKDVKFYGLNPGVIKTGIRGNIYESGIMYYLGPVVEFLLGLFMPSPESYAATMVHVLFCPTLDEHSGASFNPQGLPVESSQIFIKDDQLVSKFITGSESLVKDKTGMKFP